MHLLVLSLGQITGMTSRSLLTSFSRGSVITRKSFVSMEWSYLFPAKTNSGAFDKLRLSG